MSTAGEQITGEQRRRKSRRRVGTSMKMVEVRRRETQCLELRAAGATLAQIAEAVGYADTGAVSRAISRTLARMPVEGADKLRHLSSVRVENLHRRTMEILVRPHPVLYKGQPVMVQRDGQMVQLDDDMVRLRAVEVALKLEESHRKLWGLDMPARVEVTGEGGGPVEVSIDEVTADFVRFQRAEQARRRGAIGASSEETTGG